MATKTTAKDDQRPTTAPDPDPSGTTAAGRPAAKDPKDWTTGEEPMTGPQASYLETLSREAGEPFDPDLTKAEASERIEALQARTGRGQGGAPKGTPTGGTRDG